MPGSPLLSSNPLAVGGAIEGQADQVEVARWRKSLQFLPLKEQRINLVLQNVSLHRFTWWSYTYAAPLWPNTKNKNPSSLCVVRFYLLSRAACFPSSILQQQQLILVVWNVTACRDITCLNSITGIVSTDDCSTSVFSNASFFLGQTRRNSTSSGSREKPEPRTEPVHLQRPRKTDGVLRHVPGVLRNRNARHKVAANHVIAAGHPGSHAH